MKDDEERERVLRARQTKRVSFMNMELVSLPGALVPRRETELVAHAAIEALVALGRQGRAIDMCCGAGNLACAIATRVPETRIWASDLTDGAVANARANAEHLKIGDQLEIVQGDLFGALAGRGLEGTIDVIVCNPPYISTGRLEKDRTELLDSEPREAFDGGPYGLTIHQRAIKDALPFLRDSGWLMFEIGLGQERQVDLLFGRVNAYSTPEHRKDEAGHVRVALAKKI